jgi:hypothetical protein
MRSIVRALRGQAQPINSCSKCGAMFTGNSHTCRRYRPCPYQICHHNHEEISR